MTLTRCKPVNNLDLLSNSLLNIFDEMPKFGFDFNTNYFPKVDISEDEKNLYIDAEIPGVDKKDIKLSIQDNVLTISGEKKKEDEKKEKNYYRSERVFGSFTRSFNLSDEINTEKIDAKFQDGILKINLSKKAVEETKEKLIDIQ